MEMIGNIARYVRNMKLEKKWEERKVNPYLAKGLNPAGTSLVNQDSEEAKSQKLQSIAGKMKAGQRLSKAELDYLRENAPDVYDKAVKIEKERKAYEKRLKKCKTKDEVMRVNAQKLQQFGAEMKGIMQSSMSKGEKEAAMEDLGMRVMAILNEHNEFVKSPAFEKLPWKRELEKKKQNVVSNLEDIVTFEDLDTLFSDFMKELEEKEDTVIYSDIRKQQVQTASAGESGESRRRLGQRKFSVRV